MQYTIETIQPLIQAFLEDLQRDMAETQRQNTEIEALKQQRIASDRRREATFAIWQEEMENLWAELRTVQSGTEGAVA